MKSLKKLFSLVIGVCTLFTGVPNVFATREHINALVIGSGDAQLKFCRILFNKEIEFGDWGHAQFDEKTDVNFAFLKNGNERTPEFIKYGTMKSKKFGSKYPFNIAIAVVDTEKDIQQIKTEIRNMVDFICDYKDDYFQIIVVGCSNRDDISNTDDFMSDIANYVGGIEVECTPNKWGTSSNISFSEQFLCFTCVSKNFDKKNFLGLICRRSKDYEDIKKKQQHWWTPFINTGTK